MYRRPFFRYTKVFEDSFPYYLSIGMTPEQYWDHDCTLATAYRKADEIRLDRENQQLWMLGHYVYDALICVSPTFRAFKPQRPRKYVESPYSITKKQEKERREAEEKAKAEKVRAEFRARVEQWNIQFLAKQKKEREEEEHGCTDGRTQL